MKSQSLPLAAASALIGMIVAGHALAQNPQPSAAAAQTLVTPVSSVTSIAPVAPGLPTTKDLLQKYEAAIGGREAWSKFTSRYIKGIYQTEDASGFAAVEIFSKSPNKALSRITLPNGLVLREVCDGKSAWIEDPVGGTHMITGPGLESRIRHANFNDHVNALLMAVTGRVVGAEKVGTHQTYVLEFTPEKKLTSKLYFDQDTGFPVRADDTFRLEDGDYKVETYVDDYRQVDGAYFPYRIRHVEKGNVFTIRVTQVKNNYPVDDSLFFKPISAPK
jgi:outer membrane lipoprotein-sorting protein